MLGAGLWVGFASLLHDATPLARSLPIPAPGPSGAAGTGRRGHKRRRGPKPGDELIGEALLIPEDELWGPAAAATPAAGGWGLCALMHGWMGLL